MKSWIPAVIVIAVIIGGLVFFQQNGFPGMQATFDSELAEMQKLNSKIDLSKSPLDSTSLLDDFSGAELAGLQTDLLEFSTRARNPAAKELALIYYDYFGIGVMLLQVRSLSDSFSGTPSCENLEFFRQFKSKISAINDSGIVLVGKVSSFIQKYPKESGTVSLSAFEFTPAEQEEKDISLVVSELEGECA